MDRPFTIALDSMGGKYAPNSVLQGANLAIEAGDIPKGAKILLFGDQQKIQPILDTCPALKAVADICHTEEFVSDTDKPGAVLRKGDGTSMGMAVKAVADGRADCVVSGGNTGALMVLGRKHLKMIQGIERPAIAGPMPSLDGRRTIVLDLGATIEANEKTYLELALMGSVFARYVLKIEKPKVGIVNVGEEAQKGNAAIRAANEGISSKQLPCEYVGFIEGNDIAKGTVDVAVTDGFTGNVLLKATEGTASLVKEMFQSQAKKETLWNKMRLLVAKSTIKKISQSIDPRYYNGAMFLGLGGVCVKSHGSMDEVGFANAIKVAVELVENQFNEKVTAELPKIMAELVEFSDKKKAIG